MLRIWLLLFAALTCLCREVSAVTEDQYQQSYAEYQKDLQNYLEQYRLYHEAARQWEADHLSDLREIDAHFAEEQSLDKRIQAIEARQAVRDERQAELLAEQARLTAEHEALDRKIENYNGEVAVYQGKYDDYMNQRRLYQKDTAKLQELQAKYDEELARNRQATEELRRDVSSLQVEDPQQRAQDLIGQMQGRAAEIDQNRKQLLVDQQKLLEMNQVLYERETELETALKQLELNQAELTAAANKISELSTNLSAKEARVQEELGKVRELTLKDGQELKRLYQTRSFINYRASTLTYLAESLEESRSIIDRRGQALDKQKEELDRRFQQLLAMYEDLGGAPQAQDPSKTQAPKKLPAQAVRLHGTWSESDRATLLTLLEGIGSDELLSWVLGHMQFGFADPTPEPDAASSALDPRRSLPLTIKRNPEHRLVFGQHFFTLSAEQQKSLVSVALGRIFFEVVLGQNVKLFWEFRDSLGEEDLDLAWLLDAMTLNRSVAQPYQLAKDETDVSAQFAHAFRIALYDLPASDEYNGTQHRRWVEVREKLAEFLVAQVNAFTDSEEE